MKKDFHFPEVGQYQGCYYTTEYNHLIGEHTHHLITVYDATDTVIDSALCRSNYAIRKFLLNTIKPLMEEYGEA